MNSKTSVRSSRLGFDESLSVSVMIPARLASTRFPNKVLHLMCGYPMLWWPYQAAKMARCVDDVAIVTGDAQIIDVCRRYDMNFIQTYADHESGTDRVAEATLSTQSEYVINLQADEPTMSADIIDSLARQMVESRAPVTTLVGPEVSAEQSRDVNCVKAYIDKYGYAIDFTREEELHGRHVRRAFGRPRLHVGVYGFRVDALRAYGHLPFSAREQGERLEQLRAIDAGWRIKVVETEWVGIGVDTLEDAHRAIQFLERI